MITQKITKWGNSLGIRIPQGMIQELEWQEGDKIALSTEENRLIISLRRPKYDLDDLLKDAKPEQQHEEIDWKEVVGEENKEKPGFFEKSGF